MGEVERVGGTGKETETGSCTLEPSFHDALMTVRLFCGGQAVGKVVLVLDAKNESVLQVGEVTGKGD